MSDDNLSEESETSGEVDAEAFGRELARVGVEWEEVQAMVVEAAPKIEKPVSEDEFEVGVLLNVTLLADTLRSLPDGAGTAAFLAAFQARQAEFGALPPDWVPPPGFSAA